jgi:hypothetical protein
MRQGILYWVGVFVEQVNVEVFEVAGASSC